MKAQLTKIDGQKTELKDVTLEDIMNHLKSDEVAIVHATSTKAQVLVFKAEDSGVTVGVEKGRRDMAFRDFDKKEKAFEYALRAL